MLLLSVKVRWYRYDKMVIHMTQRDPETDTFETETAKCPQCGTLFERNSNERWKLLCLPCWKKGKKQEAEKQGKPSYVNTVKHIIAGLTAERDEALRQIASRDKRIALLEKENWLLKKTEPRYKQELFTLDELKRLRRLCHPDKHGGKSAAVDITQKINRELERRGGRK